MIKFTTLEKQIGERALRKIARQREKQITKWPIISFEQLYKILNKKEVNLMKKILNINPQKEFSTQEKFYGFKPIPKNLVLIKNQKYINFERKDKTIRVQYLSKNIYNAFEKLNQAMRQDIDRRVNITSGYRSPAYQLYVFLLYLVEYNWNFKKTIREVALPGFSEHAYAKKQAIDIGIQKSISDMKHFFKTKEYKWLKKNAHKFGFFLSFSPNNKLGTIFEPWHWHFRKK